MSMADVCMYDVLSNIRHALLRSQTKVLGVCFKYLLMMYWKYEDIESEEVSGPVMKRSISGIVSMSWSCDAVCGPMCALPGHEALVFRDRLDDADQTYEHESMVRHIFGLMATANG